MRVKMVRLRRAKKKAYCGRALVRGPISLDFALRIIFFSLILVLAIVKLPEARARVLHSGLFRLDSVALKGNRYLLDSQVMAIAGIERGACGLGLDTEKIRSRLTKHPRIKSASVRRLLWKKLYITIEERMPVALVEADRLLEIDEERVVFEPVHSALLPDLPVITGLSYRKIVLGDTLEGEGIEHAMALVEKLRDPEVNLFDQISEIHVESNGDLVLVAVQSGTPILVGSEPVTRKKLQAFKVAWADMQRKDLRPASMDLRFKDQIVAKVPKQRASEELYAGDAEAEKAVLF
jgi:cell division protein FtsQ